MILKIVPSISMWLPFLNWLVEITAANPESTQATRIRHGFAAKAL